MNEWRSLLPQQGPLHQQASKLFPGSPVLRTAQARTQAVRHGAGWASRTWPVHDPESLWRSTAGPDPPTGIKAVSRKSRAENCTGSNTSVAHILNPATRRKLLMDSRRDVVLYTGWRLRMCCEPYTPLMIIRSHGKQCVGNMPLFWASATSRLLSLPGTHRTCRPCSSSSRK
jgi:hypothetical protein